MAEETITLETRHPKSGPTTERRAWVRFLSDQEITASITDPAGTRWLGTVRDISRGGIALILRRRFERGTKLSLDLASKAGELRGLSMQVVHARWEMENGWIIGCELACPLSQEELQALLWG